GSGVGDHLDPADVELGARGVVRAGLLPAEVVADERGRQTLVGDHAVLDNVADVHQHGSSLRVSEVADPAHDPPVQLIPYTLTRLESKGGLAPVTKIVPLFDDVCLPLFRGNDQPCATTSPPSPTPTCRGPLSRSSSTSSRLTPARRTRRRACGGPCRTPC